jgi:hypothetical protein
MQITSTVDTLTADNGYTVEIERTVTFRYAAIVRDGNGKQVNANYFTGVDETKTRANEMVKFYGTM